MRSLVIGIGPVADARFAVVGLVLEGSVPVALDYAEIVIVESAQFVVVVVVLGPVLVAFESVEIATVANAQFAGDDPVLALVPSVLVELEDAG